VTGRGRPIEGKIAPIAGATSGIAESIAPAAGRRNDPARPAGRAVPMR